MWHLVNASQLLYVHSVCVCVCVQVSVMVHGVIMLLSEAAKQDNTTQAGLAGEWF